MEHFVTLFDSLFLPQGLALHLSMERHIKKYTLWILCVDDEVHDILTKFGLPNVRLLQLSKLETKELLAVKSKRTKAEYCWTLTPFSPRFVFEADRSINRVTYLDADLWFRASPQPIFDELEIARKDVLITEHAYSPEYDQSATSGKFCVQFLIFKKSRRGEKVRKWWEERCIEWCYAKAMDGKFGDQKYLDDWPNRFADSVYVLNNKELALAPWNASRFPYANAVFWHFHGLRILRNRRVDVGAFYEIPSQTFRYVYKSYLRDLSICFDFLEAKQVKLNPQAGSIDFLRLLRKIFKIFRPNFTLLRSFWPFKI